MFRAYQDPRYHQSEMRQVPMWIVLAVLLVFIQPVRVKSGKGKTDYSYSKEEQFDSPDAFWPISSTLHGAGAPTSEATAILNGATILPSGGVPSSSFGAVEFLVGASMNIINSGYLDGQTSFSWYLYVYPYESRNATILEYEGGGGGKGVTLLQEGERLTAKVYKTDGSLFGTYTRYDVALTIGEWNFIGFAYNKAWGHIDIMFGFNQGFLDLGQTDVLVNAVGKVVIGNAADGSRPFRGKMCCIQFLEFAIFKDKPLQKLETFCELNQWDTNILSWTKTFIPTTTTSTTTSPTTTTIYTTTTTTSTTTTTPTTTTPTTTTPTAVTTTTNTPATSPTTTTTTVATTTTTTSPSSTTTSAAAATTPPTPTATATTTAAAATTASSAAASSAAATTTTTATTTPATTTPATPTTTAAASTTAAVGSSPTTTTPPTIAAATIVAAAAAVTASATAPAAAAAATTTTLTLILDSSKREHTLPMTDACYYFKLQKENEEFAPGSSDLAVDDNKTIGSCAEMCSSYPQCVVFVLFENGRCRLGTSSSTLNPTTSTASKMYVKLREDREKYYYQN